MTDGLFRTIKAALTRPSSLVFGAAVWGLVMPLSLTVPAVLLVPVAAEADFVLPDTEANRKRNVVGCVQRRSGIDCSNRKGGGSPSSSSPSSSSSSASSAAARAAKLERLRQRQIQANNFRLRSIDRARSKLTYPNAIENFFRSPSIDEQWQRETGRKIQSLGRLIAAEKARINKILGDRPPDWDGSVRPPGKEPDYPLFSKGGKDSAPVALSDWAPSDLPTIDPSDLKGGKQEPASDQVSIDRIDVPSPTITKCEPICWWQVKEKLLELEGSRRAWFNDDLHRAWLRDASIIFGLLSPVDELYFTGRILLAARKVGGLTRSQDLAHLRLYRRHGTRYALTGRTAEEPFGMAIRRDPVRKKRLPRWRQEKLESTGRDRDIWLDLEPVETVLKSGRVKIRWVQRKGKGIKQTLGLVRDIKQIHTGKRSGKTGIIMDVKGYTKNYTRRQLEGIPALEYGPEGRTQHLGWSQPGWRPEHYYWTRTKQEIIKDRPYIRLPSIPGDR